MSYLVKFSGAQGETWEETFETEQQVLDCKNKDSIVSIQKIDETLTLEQLQEHVDNKTLQELQEADFNGKHIKVGDMVYFEYEYEDGYDGTINYECVNYYGIVKSITRRYNNDKIIIKPIAYDTGTLIKKYDNKYCPEEIKEYQIEQLYTVCSPTTFDNRINRLEKEKEENRKKLESEHKSFCKAKDKEIENLKALKGMLC